MVGFCGTSPSTADTKLRSKIHYTPGSRGHRSLCKFCVYRHARQTRDLANAKSATARAQARRKGSTTTPVEGSDSRRALGLCAMLQVPWSITRTRRQTPTSEPPARKRRRLIDVKARSKATTTGPGKRQQTLTQAEWIAHEPEDEDIRLQEIKESKSRHPSTVRGVLKKRDSTLTQMNFFDMPKEHYSVFDDAFLPAPDEKYTPQSACGSDGMNDSRKARKQKSSMDSVPHQRSSKKRAVSPRSSETREDKPGKRKHHAATSLDMKDNTTGIDRNEDTVFLGANSTTLALPPRTPQRRHVILSSQSPESLPPSTRNGAKFSSRIPTRSWRTPLAERSVNIIPTLDTKPSARKRTRSTRRPSPERKVVTLKLPQRNPVRRSSCVEDSQADIWSIQASSSSRKPDNKSDSLDVEQTACLDVVASQPEVPSTSQGQDNISSLSSMETQNMLPSLCSIFDIERSPSRKCTKTARRLWSPSNQRQLNHNPQGETRDFATVGEDLHSLDRRSRTSVDGIIQLDMDQVQEQVVDEFGSPIINDTQFNAAVEHRTSSPEPSKFTTSGELTPLGSAIRLSGPKPVMLEEMTSLSNEHTERSAGNTDDCLPCPPQCLPPPPRLVHQSTPDNEEKRVKTENEERHGNMGPPEPSPVRRYPGTHFSVTGVPLNDIPQPSSSPILPSLRSATERSVYPASIPHPSQISTQEPTQAFLPMSSMVSEEQDEEHRPEAGKVTIKESSSIPVSLSQLPAYSRSQSQLNIDLGLGQTFEEDDDDDLDLDPHSNLPHMQARKVEAGEDYPPIYAPHLPKRQLEEADLPTDDGEHNPDISQQPLEEVQIPSSQSEAEISMPSSPNPPPLHGQYSPIPGFDNDTQSNFTQNGHVTAAYIHRQREAGVVPDWFVPQPYQVPGYTRRK